MALEKSNRGTIDRVLIGNRIKNVENIYYINTNEIPGELSRENLIPSHVKITCYLHM